ncbi:hypothetical protein MUP00_06535 [Candidatus Bathyarchaeota archaeon]|jgi:uncharacterized coiled-coil DUF342 family protein|nr:hypothetical protein [Candidatus Bathyarchaeota archaeon]
MTAQTKRLDQLKTLDDLEGQIAELRDKFQSLRDEAKALGEKRDSLNAQNRKIWEEVKELKARRDELNQTIRKMKEERNKLHEQVIPKRKELDGLRKKMDELPGRGNTRFIAKRIEELDWEIQTNPLSLAEERELIGRVKVLEEQMLACKEAQTVRNRLVELRSEFGALRITANDIHAKMTELANQSQNLHEKMISKIRESESIKPEADAAHKKYSEVRNQADEAYKGYAETLARVKATRLQMRQEREDEEKKRIETAMTAGNEEALRKFKEKRKITLEEFKILKGKGLI